MLDDDGRMAGHAYASRHRERAAYGWAADVAVHVSPTHQRRGVGRALYTALFPLLRSQGYFKAFAGISLPMSRAPACMEPWAYLLGVFRESVSRTAPGMT